MLAEAAGVAIAGVAGIVEGGPPPAFPSAKAERMRLAADAGTPVSAGTTEIAVTVTVTYRIADRRCAVGRVAEHRAGEQLAAPRSTR